VRIEAASYRGRLVSFQIASPWNTRDSNSASNAEPGLLAGRAIALLTLLLIVVGGLYLARRNLRMGRGDRRGATRVMLFLQGAMSVGWVLNEHHVPTLWEVALLGVSAGFVVLIGGLFWVFYLASEPFVRRRRPEILTSWTRLLSGEWRDPLLGRDVLAGCAAGIAIVCVYPVRTLLNSRSGSPDWMTNPGVLDAVSGITGATGRVAGPLLVGTFIAFGYLLLFVLFAMMLRKDWLAIAALVVLRALPAIFAGSPWAVAANVVQDGILLLILLRFGLLGGITAGIIEGLFYVPLTFQTSAWYSPVGFVALFLVAAISIYAFRTSLGNRPALALLPD
jgi:serine/threonine-protein kinase